MTKCKKPTPYDPKLIAAQCNPVTLRLGCAAGCWKGEDFDMCGKPPVAIRRWTRDDGYDDCELLPEACTDPRASYMPTMMSSRCRRC